MIMIATNAIVTKSVGPPPEKKWTFAPNPICCIQGVARLTRISRLFGIRSERSSGTHTVSRSEERETSGRPPGHSAISESESSEKKGAC